MAFLTIGIIEAAEKLKDELDKLLVGESGKECAVSGDGKIVSVCQSDDPETIHEFHQAHRNCCLMETGLATVPHLIENLAKATSRLYAEEHGIPLEPHGSQQHMPAFLASLLGGVLVEPK